MVNERQQTTWFGEGFKTELDQGRRIIITPDPKQIIRVFIENHSREIIWKTKSEGIDFALARYVPKNSQFKSVYGLSLLFYGETSESQLFSFKGELSLLVAKLQERGEALESSRRIDDILEAPIRHFDIQLVRYEREVVPASKNPFENKPVYAGKCATRAIIYGPSNMPLGKRTISGNLVCNF